MGTSTIASNNRKRASRACQDQQPANEYVTVAEAVELVSKKRPTAPEFERLRAQLTDNQYQLIAAAASCTEDDIASAAKNGGRVSSYRVGDCMPILEVQRDDWRIEPGWEIPEAADYSLSKAEINQLFAEAVFRGPYALLLSGLVAPPDYSCWRQ